MDDPSPLHLRAGLQVRLLGSDFRSAFGGEDMGNKYERIV